jgi:oxygen-independent coproporphyrinogen-3 oxidase
MAIFSYAHVPWIRPAQKLLEKAGLPAAETKFQLLKLSVEKLAAAGYACIGMDHFARADNDLAVAQRNGTLQRNFQGYSTRAGADVYGIGNSSMSQTAGAYWQNEKQLEDYYTHLEGGRLPIWSGYVLTEDDRVRRQTIMRLMCDFHLNYDAMSRKLGIDFREYYSAELASLRDLQRDGLIQLDRDELRVTGAGRLLVRVIAMRFDQFMKARSAEKVYSRTI